MTDLQSVPASPWPSHVDGCEEGDEEGLGCCDPGCPRRVLALQEQADDMAAAQPTPACLQCPVPAVCTFCPYQED